MTAFKSVAIAVVTLCMLSTAAQAAVPVLITFDAGDPIGGLAAGETLGNQYAAYGVTFVPNGFTGPGGPTVDWAGNTDMTIVSSRGNDVGGLGSPSLVSGNILHSFSGWTDENGDPSFVANFSHGVTSFSADFAGVFYPESVGLYAYNGANLLGSVFGSIGTGQFTLSISNATPITRVVIANGASDDWVGVDNLRFTAAAVVPEPSTYAMFGLGLGLLGLMARKRAA